MLNNISVAVIFQRYFEPCNPGEVNRIIRLPNQSNFVEPNRMIEIRLAELVERQSNLTTFS